MSYKSPIEIIMDDIRKQTIIQEENNVLRAVWRSGVNVDKEELIKALNYDRGQYEKGYQDAEQKYEAALDKACEQLADFDKFLHEEGYDNDENWTKEEWKEVLMKDEI